MVNRLFCMGIASIIAVVSGSIQASIIVFGTAAILIAISWLIIDRLVPHG